MFLMSKLITQNLIRYIPNYQTKRINVITKLNGIYPPPKKLKYHINILEQSNSIKRCLQKLPRIQRLSLSSGNNPIMWVKGLVSCLGCHKITTSAIPFKMRKFKEESEERKEQELVFLSNIVRGVTIK